MIIARTIVAVLLVAFAAYVVVMNWMCAIISLRNRRKGIDKHHSTVPVLSIIIIIIAAIVYPRDAKWWMGVWPLLDVGNWQMVRVPFLLISERRSERSPASSPEDGRPETPPEEEH